MVKYQQENHFTRRNNGNDDRTDLTAPFIDGLYGKFVEGGIGYFFPRRIRSLELARMHLNADSQTADGTSLILNWLGSRYSSRGMAFLNRS